MQRAIFLDRDGTLNKNMQYLYRFEDFEIVPGALEGLKALQNLGFRLYVVTNQSGIARGFFTKADVESLHLQMGQYFADQGIKIEEFVFCPHLPTGTVPEYTIDCHCRKPNPGMLLGLAEKYNIDMTQSFMVGDMARDVEAGLKAGTESILLKPDADPKANWDRLDSQTFIKEFVSLIDFANSLR